MFQVQLTNFHFNSDPFPTFELAEAFARKAGFEAAIFDLDCETNWGCRLVATYSPIAGLRDLRPFAGRPDPYGGNNG
jgi:hypothetical protein